jgi:hypothetical protein
MKAKLSTHGPRPAIKRLTFWIEPSVATTSRRWPSRFARSARREASAWYAPPADPVSNDARKEPKSRTILEFETTPAMIADAARSKRPRNIVLRRQTELAFTGPFGLVVCAKYFLAVFLSNFSV